MIILGIILLVIGFLLGFSVVEVIGAILVIAGLILLLLGRSGRPVGGRRNYW